MTTLRRTARVKVIPGTKGMTRRWGRDIYSGVERPEPGRGWGRMDPDSLLFVTMKFVVEDGFHIVKNSDTEWRLETDWIDRVARQRAIYQAELAAGTRDLPRAAFPWGVGSESVPTQRAGPRVVGGAGGAGGSLDPTGDFIQRGISEYNGVPGEYVITRINGVTRVYRAA